LILNNTILFLILGDSSTDTVEQPIRSSRPRSKKKEVVPVQVEVEEEGDFQYEEEEEEDTKYECEPRSESYRTADPKQCDK